MIGLHLRQVDSGPGPLRARVLGAVRRSDAVLNGNDLHRLRQAYIHLFTFQIAASLIQVSGTHQRRAPTSGERARLTGDGYGGDDQAEGLAPCLVKRPEQIGQKRVSCLWVHGKPPVFSWRTKLDPLVKTPKWA